MPDGGAYAGLLNGDFSKVDTKGEIVGWTSAAWPMSETPLEIQRTEKDGLTCVEISVPSQAATGCGSASHEMGPLNGGFVVSGKYRVSEDFQGARPWVFLAWYQQGKYGGRLDINTAPSSTQKWVNFRQKIRAEDIPAGATSVVLNVAAFRVPSAEKHSGKIYYGELAMEPLATAATDTRVAPLLRLRADTPASWWKLGQAVRYVYTGTGWPTDLKSLSGRVIDSSGQEVARVIADAAKLKAYGWSWLPREPGFYEVEFSYITSGSEKSTPVVQSYELKAPNGAVREFVRPRFQFVVAAGEAVPDYQKGQFGFSYLLSTSDIPLAKLIGFDFAFIHSIPWGGYFLNRSRAVEPQPGQYRWENIDPHVEALSTAGFKLGAQFCYTPNWASPYPEKSKQVNVCIYESMSYAPRDLSVFENFVSKVVERYKDKIHIWEIWNEPNMPGASCFWLDTPENYCRMLQVGYQAVKKVQPDAEVWIGGLGPRRSYHAFYNRIMRLGASEYFDVLSLHGSWNSPDAFEKINQDLSKSHKPSVVSEWHAILTATNQVEPVASESELSRKMMMDLLYQMKKGVSRSVFFHLSNGLENEALSFAREQRWTFHSSGLFRARPSVEPRLPALILQNFLLTCGNGAAYEKEGRLTPEVATVILKTKQGPVAVLWVENKVRAREALSAVATSRLSLRNWEGKSLTMAENPSLNPGELYYASGLPQQIIDRMLNTEVLISPRQVKSKNTSVPQATAAVGKLFNTVNDSVSVPSSSWVSDHWVRKTLTDRPSKEDVFSARFAVGIHDEGLDLVVEVNDISHDQREKKPQWWFGDSLQFAIDCDGSGFLGGNSEFVAALTTEGSEVWKLAAADVGGDIPTRWSRANSLATYVQSSFQRKGNQTLYKIRVPWTEIYPMVFDINAALRISLVVNNNNGEGRSEYVEWGGGIGQDKDPALYGILNPKSN